MSGKDSSNVTSAVVVAKSKDCLSFREVNTNKDKHMNTDTL